MKHLIQCIVLLFVREIICIDPIVLTQNGLVRGFLADNGKYANFLGIPYAKVNPDNPFGHTLQVPPFEKTYEAIDDSAICPQQDDMDFSIVGTLDCLRINVYVPNEASTQNKLPVMVWIHGGGFRRWNSNRSSYGPDFLVRKGVILVTFNYRLGAYGFMSLNTTEIPGNAGLRDQLLALQWVKDNIAAFGGDEENITLFGESAGAASVEFHILSGYSDGLFHKAIMQSGTVLCDWVMRDPDIHSPIKLAEYMGLETENVDEALDFLSQSDPHDVIRATIGIGYAEFFKPAVEHEFEGVRAMIKDKPSNLLKKTSFSIPVIIGFNSRERLQDLYYYLQSPHGYFENTNKTFKAKINDYFELDEDELVNAEEIVRRFYIGSKEIGEDTVDEMIEFDSDFTFIYPSLRNSRYYLQASSAPVYLYMFDYAGERNYLKYRFNLTSESGAMHADEIGYLFHQSYYVEPETPSSTDITMIHQMTAMWTDFAKTGNPTPKSRELVPFIWMPSTVEPSQSYAVLNEKTTMQQHPYHQRMALWDAMFSLYEHKAKW